MTRKLAYAALALVASMFLAVAFLPFGGCTPTESAPVLAVSATALTFGLAGPPQTVQVRNSGGGTCDWTITDDQPWITVAPTSGSTGAGQQAAVTVSVAEVTAAAGETRTGTITVTSDVGTATIQVTQANDPPVLALSTAALTFGLAGPPQTLQVQNTGGHTLTWTITDDQPWLTVSPESGSTEGEQQTAVTVSVAEVSGAAGETRTGTITVASNGGTATVQVTQANDPPALALSPTFLTFGLAGPPQTVQVQNTGGHTLSWTITDDQPWITVSPESGSTEGEQQTAVTVSVAAAGETRTGTILVSSNGGSATIEVTQSDQTATHKVAWESDRSGNWEIYVANTDGTGLVNVSNNSADDRFPSLSADGSKVAWESWRDGNAEVYVANADGTGLLNASSHTKADGDPSLSEDGSNVAWVSYRDGNAEVYVTNTDGTGLVNVSNDGAVDYSPSLSADGSKVAWTRHRDGPLEIYVANADGTGLVNVSGGAVDYSPSLSADGSKVAWMGRRDGNWYYEIYVANTDGTGLVNVSNDGADDEAPSLSPDGSKVAWVSYRDGNPDVYVANTDGTGLVNVSKDGADDVTPSLSADGGKAAWVSYRDGNAEIYVSNRDGTGLVNVSNSSANDALPSLQGN